VHVRGLDSRRRDQELDYFDPANTAKVDKTVEEGVCRRLEEFCEGRHDA